MNKRGAYGGDKIEPRWKENWIEKQIQLKLLLQAETNFLLGIVHETSRP